MDSLISKDYLFIYLFIYIKFIGRDLSRYLQSRRKLYSPLPGTKLDLHLNYRVINLKWTMEGQLNRSIISKDL